MKKDLGRIGVLLGGPSSEREISIRSGAAVCKALLSLGLDVVSIDPKDAISAKKDILDAKIDVAFIALHGRFGEDGTIQAMLDDMGIPYTGSGPTASHLALNKILSKKIFSEYKIPTPRYNVFSRLRMSNNLAREFSLPFVIKPANEGSSIGMTIVEKESDIINAIRKAFMYDDDILIEEYINGDDITVGILQDRPLPVVHIKPKAKFYSFEAKYTQGMSEYIVPAELPETVTKEAQRLAVLAHRAVGCRSFSRVDMILDKRDSSALWVLEINTIPGLTSTSLLPKAAWAMGMDFAQMCLRMVESALVGV